MTFIGISTSVNVGVLLLTNIILTGIVSHSTKNKEQYDE